MRVTPAASTGSHRRPLDLRGSLRGAAPARRRTARSSAVPTAGRLYGLRKMPVEPVEITVPIDTFGGAFRRGRGWSAADHVIDRRATSSDVRWPRRVAARAHAVPPRRRVQPVPVRAGCRGHVASRPRLAGCRRPTYLARHPAGRAGPAWRAMERWLARTRASMRRPSAERTRAGDARPRRRRPVFPSRCGSTRFGCSTAISSTSTWPGRTSASGSSRVTRGGTAVTPTQRSDQARDRACTEVGWHVVRCDEVDDRGARHRPRQIRTHVPTSRRCSPWASARAAFCVISVRLSGGLEVG